MQLESDMFPNVKWNDEPTEVELVIHNNGSNRCTLREFIESIPKEED